MKTALRCPRCRGNLFPSIDGTPEASTCLLCTRTFVPVAAAAVDQIGATPAPRAA